MARCGSGAPCVGCQDVAACVNLSEQAGNRLTGDAQDGLFVAPVGVPVAVAGPGVTVTGAPPSGQQVAARAASARDNAMRIGAAGLYVPQCVASQATTVADTATVDLGAAGATISGQMLVSGTAGNLAAAAGDGLLVTVDPAALISADPGNDLAVGGDGGLFAPACTPEVTPAGAGLSLDPVTGYNLNTGRGVTTAADSTAIGLSAQPGNTATFGADTGLYVPSAVCAMSGADPSASIDWQITGAGVLSGAVRRSADAGNVLTEHGDGLWAPAAGVPDTAGLVSADAGNQLALGADLLLYTPAPPGRAQAGAGLADDGVAFSVAADTTKGLAVTGAEPADVLGVKRSADAGNALGFGTDGGVYATASPMTMPFNAVLNWSPPDVAIPVSGATPVWLKFQGGVANDRSGGRIVYDSVSGLWNISRAMHVQVDVSMRMTQNNIAAGLSFEIGGDTEQGVIPIWVFLNRNVYVMVQFTFVCSFAASGGLLLYGWNRGGASVNIVRTDCNVTVWWLGDA